MVGLGISILKDFLDTLAFFEYAKINCISIPWYGKIEKEIEKSNSI